MDIEDFENITLAEYANELDKIVNSSPFIVEKDIQFDVDIDSHSLKIRGQLTFTNGSRIDLFEYLVKEKKITRKYYRFHWRGVDNDMIIRYDNSPHHRELDNFPYHKHSAGQRKPIGDRSRGLLEVVAEIERKLLEDEENTEE